MDFVEFEERELERFLNMFCGYQEIGRILYNLEEWQHKQVRTKTKEGIKKGIEDFLETHKNEPETLYLSNLAEFCHDESVETKVKEEIERFDHTLEGTSDYARFICQSYRTFIYNDSKTKFQELFQHDSLGE